MVFETTTEKRQRQSLECGCLRKNQPMNKIDTGGPAFPYTERSWCTETDQWVLGETIQGATLRDYFAAKAMPAIIEKFSHPEKDDFDSHFQLISAMAYAQADAMLEARK